MSKLDQVPTLRITKVKRKLMGPTEPLVVKSTVRKLKQEPVIIERTVSIIALRNALFDELDKMRTGKEAKHEQKKK